MKSYFSFFRRAVQLASLGLFIWLLSKTLWPLAEWPVDIFLRSDPLLALSIPLAARAFVAKLVPGLIVIASALLLGRFFCGWLCPMGTTLDLAGLVLRRKTPGPETSRLSQIRFFLLAGIVAAALLGANYAFWAAPIPLITRFYAIVLHPALLWSADTALTYIPLYAPGFEANFSVTPRSYDSAVFVLIFFALLFGLERIQPRFWCRNLCPAGAVLALLSRLPLWRRRVRHCVSCGLCARQCPARAISGNGLSASHGDCLTCLRCVDICPQRGLSFRPPPTPPALKVLESPPGRLCLSRRAFIGGSALGLGGGLLRLIGARLWPFPAAQKLAEDFALPVVRPPGSRPEHDFLALCARCGECLKACPTGGLQAVWPGPSGLFSPTLSPRRGPCEPECNACGQVCPTGAIAPLDMSEKRWAKMGTAVVRQETCLAWAEKRSCVVCQEVCPYGAVALRVTPGSAGISVPVVRLEYCYGCGYCQYHCPTAEPAIVIEAREALRLTDGQYKSAARAKGFELDPLERAPVELPDDQLPPGFLE